MPKPATGDDRHYLLNSQSVLFTNSFSAFQKTALYEVTRLNFFMHFLYISSVAHAHIQDSLLHGTAIKY
jgi:hypothetical protein